MIEPRLRSITPTIDIYIRLAQYPILADRVRERMRQELYRRGIVHPDQFEREVRELSIASQRREGLGDPYFEEDSHTWQLRQERIRDYHTDAYFANNLGIAQLDALIEEVLDSESEPPAVAPISFNPEIAPWELLFQQGEIYENMSQDEREKNAHHLEEIKVVLIKRLMSDQLPFIGVAKRVLTVSDLRRIHSNLIGTGKIGGKAAGMILAWRSLRSLDEASPVGAIGIPDSYFIGTDVIYEFFLQNKLQHHMNQKYRPVSEIRAAYPAIVDDFLAGQLPEYVSAQLSEVIHALGNTPLVVRSSSLLENNFGFSFAGKYNSYFCPNQGTPEENLACVEAAIRRIYASSLNPDALLYRKKHNLIDYDERMAIMIQRITGRTCGRYYYPDIAGVGFSQNPFCWAPEIRRGDGFLRIVTGLGTRAVERVAQDYPRLVPLSHPHLRPEDSLEAKRNYSQRFMAVVDLEANAVRVVPARDVLADCPSLLALVASEDIRDDLVPIAPENLSPESHIVLTFDRLTDDQGFIDFMRDLLQQLEETYLGPVDVEFAVEIDYGEGKRGHENPRHYHLNILECRPLNRQRYPVVEADREEFEEAPRLFALPTLLESGMVENIEYLVFVDPECYYDLGDEPSRLRVADTITRLNDLLPAGRFGLIGPGRWGSANSRLSVPITYSDICNSKLLIEISPPYSPAPELAYGTDFLEELVEAGIYVLGIQPMQDDSQFDWQFLRESANHLVRFLPEDGDLADCVRVIDLQEAAGSPLRLMIDNETNEAIACFDIPQSDSD